MLMVDWRYLSSVSLLKVFSLTCNVYISWVNTKWLIDRLTLGEFEWQELTRFDVYFKINGISKYNMLKYIYTNVINFTLGTSWSKSRKKKYYLWFSQYMV